MPPVSTTAAESDLARASRPRPISDQLGDLVSVLGHAQGYALEFEGRQDTSTLGTALSMAEVALDGLRGIVRQMERAARAADPRPDPRDADLRAASFAFDPTLLDASDEARKDGKP